MRMRWWIALCFSLALPASAQPVTRQTLSQILGFENGQPGTPPARWGCYPAGTCFTDAQVVHSGKLSARIERNASDSDKFSNINASIPLDFMGQSLELRGFVKTENVSSDGAAAIWLREDDANGAGVQFASTEALGVKGTTDWTEYSIKLPVVAEGQVLYLGALLSRTGKMWVDDLQLLVDGQPVANAPVLIPTGFSLDHAYDGGSRIAITNLSDVQVQNLAKLAKVWGFLKYHHPAIASGQRQWDYDLFRVLPSLLSAPDGAAANQVIAAWITERLGNVVPCMACASLDTSDLSLGTNLNWLSDVSLLGTSLSQTLQSIYLNRNAAATHFFVALTPGPANPIFQNELKYAALKLPDSGYQLLGLFRFWNMVQYFYPNRDVMADDPLSSPNYWDDVLKQSIPGIATAQNSLAYQQQLLLFIAKIHDTHANLWSSLAARPPLGVCQLPVQIRFVEGLPVVGRYLSSTTGPASGLKVGDVIERLDSAPVEDLVAQWTPYYADSNQAARLRDIGNSFTQGACGPSSALVLRGKQELSLTPDRVPISSLDFSAAYTHDLPGNAFQLLSSDIGYIKLSAPVVEQSALYILSASKTKGLIIDIRNYPADFSIFALGSLLVSEPVDFARFSMGDVANPGAFHWLSPLELTPAQPHYAGKVIILVDEITQSSAEYHAMAFRTAPGALVIGSTTAGADGNVSAVPLPGGFRSYISGIGVFYPDKRATQRVGIVPDIFVAPTIEGIRAGRDEVLEEAIHQIQKPPRGRPGTAPPRDHPILR